MADDPSKEALVIRGNRIREDINGNVCLDDIWRAAGQPDHRQPPQWKRLPTTKELRQALLNKMGKSHSVGIFDEKSVYYFSRKKGDMGSYAHPILAAAYAGYLNPDLEIEVREVWLRHRAGDASLADEILQNASAKDNEWAGRRALGRAVRKDYTAMLKDHGVKMMGYARCTNAVYDGLFEKTAKQMKVERSLPEKASLRDNMDTSELTYVMASEALATERIDEENCWGTADCADASKRSASFIREAIERDRADRTRRTLDI